MNISVCPNAGDKPKIIQPLHPFFEKMIDRKINQVTSTIFDRFINYVVDICSNLCFRFYPAYRERLQFLSNRKLVYHNDTLVCFQNGSEKEFNFTDHNGNDIPDVPARIKRSDKDPTMRGHNVDNVSLSIGGAPIFNQSAQHVTVVRNSDATSEEQQEQIYINDILVCFRNGHEMNVKFTDQNTQNIKINNISGHPNLVKIIETKIYGIRNIWQVDIDELESENPSEEGQIKVGAHLYYNAQKIAYGKEI